MKILNHEGHEEHEGTGQGRKQGCRSFVSLSFSVFFVSFVVEALVWN